MKLSTNEPCVSEVKYYPKTLMLCVGFTWALVHSHSFVLDNALHFHDDDDDIFSNFLGWCFLVPLTY